MKKIKKQREAKSPSKPRKDSDLKERFEEEKNLKNEAYFFIIESGNFDNFKNWIKDRRGNGQTAATAHKDCLLYLSGKNGMKQAKAQQQTSQQKEKDELIETLRNANQTQRKLINLQEERITQLTELLAVKMAAK